MPELKKKKILIFEDEKPIARALELKLIHSNFEVVVASDGQKGLKILEEQAVDLILLDLIMPKMNGFEVLEALKKLNIKTSVMVLTNLSQEDDEKRVRPFGVKEFFVKSNIDLATIVKRVNDLLK